MTSTRFDYGNTWPQLPEFVELGKQHRAVPVVRRLLGDGFTPVGVYSALTHNAPNSFILESVQPSGNRSRYSFIGLPCTSYLEYIDGQALWHGPVPEGLGVAAPADAITEALEALASEPIPGLPPFTGGLVGALGWDLVRLWEQQLPAPAPDDMRLPDGLLLLATEVAVMDHVNGSIWLIANAINYDGQDDGIATAYERAVARLDAMEADLLAAKQLPLARLAEMAGPDPEEKAVLGDEGYQKLVAACLEAIAAGEVVQVVPSQRFELPVADSFAAYRVLRALNPSPYMFYLKLSTPSGGEFALAGSSPESLVKVEDGKVSTFPIGGSRPRGASPAADKSIEAELRADPKELAEHEMLVDLAQADLSIACATDSIAVSDYMTVNRYSHVMHICSTVSGVLSAGKTAWDAFRATFPAGTLSGSPKRRALEIIAEIEPVRRGFYGGAVGYFDFTGNSDFAIAIRSAVFLPQRTLVQAGAGVVADSVPAHEDAETRHKAAAVVQAVKLALRLD